MTFDEYQNKLKQLEVDHEAAQKALMRLYAYLNNPYKEGETIKDHIGTGIIRQINFYLAAREPQCVYICDNILANGKISKKEPKRHIYQSNIKL